MNRAPAPLDLAWLRRRQQRAAADYAQAAQVEQEIGRRLLEHLDPVRLAPQTIVDLGCGTGHTTMALAARYPQAQILALDHAEAMLDQLSSDLYGSPGGWLRRLQKILTQPASPERATIHRLLADMHAPPLAPGSVDLLWSHFAMQWTNDLPGLIAAWTPLLRQDGLFMFALPGPDTGIELRRALERAGLAPRLHEFTDLHDIGDMLLRAGLADPVMEMESLKLEYPDVRTLWRELRALGLASARRDRPRGLMTPRQLARLQAELEVNRKPGAPLAITLEVIYGHAWKPAPTIKPPAQAVVPVHAIGRRRRSGP